MIIELTKTEDSVTFTLPLELAQKLALTDKAELTIEDERLVLQKPRVRQKLSLAEAEARSDEKFANAYRELAK